MNLYKVQFVKYEDLQERQKSYKIVCANMDQTEELIDLTRFFSIKNVFDYDSEDNVWATHSAELEPIKKQLEKYLSQYLNETRIDLKGKSLDWDGWFVSSANSNTHLLKHSHKGHADICVLFYFFVDDSEEDNGKLEIFPPDSEVEDADVDFVLISPSSGLIVIFPGASPHRVRNYRCSRLAIATNIKFI